MTAREEAPTFQLALEEDNPPPMKAAVIGALIGAAFWLLLFGICALVVMAR